MIDPETLSWWNTIPSRLDDTFFTLFGRSGIFGFGTDPLGGGFPVRWYGLMYLFAFFTCYKMMKVFNKRNPVQVPNEHIEALLTWVVLGILIGGRVGYVLFYNFSQFMADPLQIISPFHNGHFVGIAGMSYHGGLIGATVGGLLCLRKYKATALWPYLNLAFLCAPLGYTWGRLGNFLNGELYGRATDAPIGMLFPSDKLGLLRHPSQLYEMFGEGLLLFLVLMTLRRFAWSREMMFPLYIMGYGLIRFIVEFFREPDAHLGLQLLGLSRGQYLCLAMFVVGLGIFVARRIYLSRQSAPTGA